MCLVVIAWRKHPHYPLVVAANRDELHARPTAPLAPWDEPPGIVGGRDLEAGGTWLGLDGGSRLGIVTNFRERLVRRHDAPSRGGLIPGFLSGRLDAESYLERLKPDAGSYAGFNLLLLDQTGLWYACNRSKEFARPLPAGVYGLANHELDMPWPKLVRARTKVNAWIERTAARADSAVAEELFDILYDREPAALDATDHDDLAAGLPAAWRRAVSAPFVVNPEYGTRCSTVILADRTGRCVVRERSFSPDAGIAGERALVLDGFSGEIEEPARARDTLT